MIDHENPSNPPYTILDGASSTETEPLAIINELADVGGVVVCQSSFTMTTEAGTASFIGTVIAFP